MQTPYLNECTNDPTLHLCLARVVKVYDEILTAPNGYADYGSLDIIWLDGQGDSFVPIKACLPWSSWSYGCGISILPNIGDIVSCLRRPEGLPVVVGYYPYKAAESCAKGENTKIGNVVPSLYLGSTRSLKSGEILLKSNKQGEVYLDRNGNIRLISRTQAITESFTLPFTDSNKTQTRVKSRNNTQVELILGAATTNEKLPTATDPNIYALELDSGGKEIRAKLRVIDNQQLPSTTVAIASSANFSAGKIISGIVSVIGLYNGSLTTFEEDLDFELNSAFTGITWLNKRQPTTSFDVVYTIEEEKSKITINEDGDINVTTVNDISVNGKNLTEVIQETVTQTIKDLILHVTNNLTSTVDGSVVETIKGNETTTVTGDVKINSGSGKTIDLNTGTYGVARTEDAVVSTGAEDTTFWPFMTQLISLLKVHVHVSAAPGSPTAPSISFNTLTAPTSLTGKITGGSTKVKAG